MPFYHHEFVKRALSLAIDQAGGSLRNIIRTEIGRARMTYIHGERSYSRADSVRWNTTQRRSCACSQCPSCTARLNTQCPKRIMELLGYLNITGLVNGTQFAKGFARVATGLKEMCLDVPDADEQFATLVVDARGRGLLPAGLSAGPARKCSKHHRVAFESRNEGQKTFFKDVLSNFCQALSRGVGIHPTERGWVGLQWRQPSGPRR